MSLLWHLRMGSTELKQHPIVVTRLDLDFIKKIIFLNNLGEAQGFNLLLKISQFELIRKFYSIAWLRIYFFFFSKRKILFWAEICIINPEPVKSNKRYSFIKIQLPRNLIFRRTNLFFSFSQFQFSQKVQKRTKFEKEMKNDSL